MENQNISEQNCGCSDGCCTPQKEKNSKWTKWIFVAIILAAAVIVTVKLVSKPDVPEQCCPTTENATCC
jgi:hypothetical protein